MAIAAFGSAGCIALFEIDSARTVNMLDPYAAHVEFDPTNVNVFYVSCMTAAASGRPTERPIFFGAYQGQI